MIYNWAQLADGVHRCRLPFLDVTIGLVTGRDGVLLVDTGSTLSEAAAIAADVRHIAGDWVSHVVLTHRHFDHVLGSSLFADAEIYCSPKVSQYLSSGTELLRADALCCGADPGEIDRAIAALRIPDCPTNDAVVDLGDRAVTITHLGPGHTAADLVVLVPGEPAVVFAGDLIEESGDPQLDNDSDLTAWPVTLDRMLALGGPDAIYVPGHGQAVDAQFVRQQRDWLLTQ
ncbi:MAG: MBL fold metallo-hydrolase [Mycobacteriaceae bacterium]|nr:MBL fold metallo-hydrolase [Mycobacteriaceae bacterium]